MKTIEGGILIVEFMNIPKCDRCKDCGEYKFGSGIYYSPEQMSYHSSWDWLMPVVEKIHSIDVTPPPNYAGYRIEIVVQGYVKIEGPFPFPRIFKNVSACGSLINAVWESVVAFIQYYNIQKQ